MRCFFIPLGCLLALSACNNNTKKEEETQEAFKYRLNLVEQLWACASEQGLGDASISLGSSLKFDKKYAEAVKTFQQGVKNGHYQAAYRLSSGFSPNTTSDNQLDYLGLPKSPT